MHFESVKPSALVMALVGREQWNLNRSGQNEPEVPATAKSRVPSFWHSLDPGAEMMLLEVFLGLSLAFL